MIAAFADLLETTTGLRSPESNRSHLRRVLSQEIRSTGLSAQALLTTCRSDRTALQHLIDGAMIGETYFFREVAQFRYLRDVVLPHLIPQRRSIAVWSASCSSGEEAISLAVLLDSMRGGIPREQIGVYASDIRSDMPDRIRSGRYPLSALRHDGREFHELFRKRYVLDEEAGKLTVAPEVIAMLTPLTINLFHDPLDAIPNDLEIVFFRNTLIYAPAENRQTIINRIVDKIAPGGYLFLANSELPFVTHADLELVEGEGAYCLRRQTTKAAVVIGSPAQGASDSAGAGGTAPGTPDPPTPQESAGARGCTFSDVLLVIDRLPPEVADVEATHTATIKSEEEHLARAVLRLFADLDAGRFDRAARHLDEISVIQPEGQVVSYCTAWFDYCTGDTEGALEKFLPLSQEDKTLWPVHFYRGKIHRTTDPSSARSDLAACIREIDRSPFQDYRFLVGGFDRKQIRSLCERWIETIDSQNGGSTKVESSNGS